MNSKKWIIRSFILVALFIFSIISFNLWLDPYGIVHPDKRKFITQPNLNYLKTHYITTHQDLYKNFIFGSSRVGNINPFYLKEPLFYNMTYPDAIPQETLNNLQEFLRSGVEINTVLLGLDEFNTQISYNKRQYQGLTRDFPEDSLLAKSKLYLFYYLKFPSKLDISVLKQRIFKHNEGNIVGISDQKTFYKTFMALNTTIDKKLVQHISDKKFLKPTVHNDRADHDPLIDIQQIISLCQKKGIRLIIFTNPIHHTNHTYLDKHRYDKFKQDLQKLTEFYDFSGPNSVTGDNKYFYEPAHYRPVVGNYILDRIFFDKQFKDFGIFRPKTQ